MAGEELVIASDDNMVCTQTTHKHGNLTTVYLALHDPISEITALVAWLEHTPG